MKDFQQVYATVIKKAVGYGRALPFIALSIFAYLALNSLVASAVYRYIPGPGLLLGTLMWIFRLMIMSHLAGLMQTLVSRGELRFQDIFSLDLRHFSAFSQVYFYFYLIELLVDRTLVPILSAQVAFYILIAFSLFTGPAFEAVHIADENMISIFPSLAGYWWTNMHILLPLGLLSLSGYLWIWPAIEGTIYSIVGNNVVAEYLSYGLQACILSVFYLFRDCLFRETYFSNPRSRAFKGGYR